MLATKIKKVFDRGPNTIWPGQDICCGFFEDIWNAGRLTFPQGAKVLEVGCAEVDWPTPMKTLRPDLHITCVDQRGPGIRPGADVLVEGNLLDPALFEPESFDVIVAVSVIEHVGIGRYGDPIDEAGDTKAMANLHLWIKPDGFLYMDVPFRPVGPSTDFRAYNPEDLQTRVINGWTETYREVFAADHADSPWIALILTP